MRVYFYYYAANSGSTIIWMPNWKSSRKYTGKIKWRKFLTSTVNLATLANSLCLELALLGLDNAHCLAWIIHTAWLG